MLTISDYYIMSCSTLKYGITYVLVFFFTKIEILSSYCSGSIFTYSTKSAIFTIFFSKTINGQES
jgi:hypothetical protein